MSCDPSCLVSASDRHIAQWGAGHSSVRFGKSSAGLESWTGFWVESCWSHASDAGLNLIQTFTRWICWMAHNLYIPQCTFSAYVWPICQTHTEVLHTRDAYSQHMLCSFMSDLYTTDRIFPAYAGCMLILHFSFRISIFCIVEFITVHVICKCKTLIWQGKTGSLHTST